MITVLVFYNCKQKPIKNQPQINSALNILFNILVSLLLKTYFITDRNVNETIVNNSGK